jgi:phenylalanyl-tRNA synthetase beta chain
MPTLSVEKSSLYQKIGKSFTDDQFDEICFQFGIELDEVTSERQIVAKEQGEAAARGLSDEVIYKIELPANRYDLLTVEGLSRALRSFLLGADAPKYQLKRPAEPIRINVMPETSLVRPFVVGAVLRGMTFTQDIYDSFIELQDKLHSGVGRRRAIASMGTHDLDTLSAPFTYAALPPEQIQFVPLNKTQKVNGHELIQLYESDLKIKKFLHIIRDEPRFPVILDAEGRVASLPPLINSEHSKIKLSTKNIFIELTATDENKAMIALNCLTTSFAEYCDSVELVEVVYPSGRIATTPDFGERTVPVSIEYINGAIGIKITPAEAVALLKKMMLVSEVASDNKTINVCVPAFRSDILHPCDIMEDVAIAYGFNNINRTLPISFCVASPMPLNKLSDLIRKEIALVGFTEVLTLTLCSKEENYDWLLRIDPGNEAVVLENPKTIEYQQVHTMLIPEMLKTLASNKALPLPLKIFQVADVCFLDEKNDVGARNERRLSVAFSNNSSSGLEVVHGVLDRVMAMMAVPTSDYKCIPSSLPYYFPGRQAQVVLKGNVIGAFGILHPQVLKNFEVPNVTSILEINIEPFL